MTPEPVKASGIRRSCPKCSAEWWWAPGPIEIYDHRRPDGRACRMSVEGDDYASVLNDKGDTVSRHSTEAEAMESAQLRANVYGRPCTVVCGDESSRVLPED